MEELILLLRRLRPERELHVCDADQDDPFAQDTSIVWEHWMDLSALDLMAQVIPLMFGHKPSDRRPRPYLHPDWWDRVPHPHEKEGGRIVVVLVAALRDELGEKGERHADKDRGPYQGWTLTLLEFVDWARRRPSIFNALPEGMRPAADEKRRLLYDTDPSTPPTSASTMATSAFTLPGEVTKWRKREPGFVAYVALRVAGFDVKPKSFAEAIGKLTEAEPPREYLTGAKGRWVEGYSALAESVGPDSRRWGEALAELRRWAGLKADPDRA